jgi:hypothetical protein
MCSSSPVTHHPTVTSASSQFLPPTPPSSRTSHRIEVDLGRLVEFDLMSLLFLDLLAFSRHKLWSARSIVCRLVRTYVVDLYEYIFLRPLSNYTYMLLFLYICTSCFDVFGPAALSSLCATLLSGIFRPNSLLVACLSLEIVPPKLMLSIQILIKIIQCLRWSDFSSTLPAFHARIRSN